MELQELISNLIIDTKGQSVGLLDDPMSSISLFLPEIVLCLTIVAVLLLRLFEPLNWIDRRMLSKLVPGGLSSIVAFLGVLLALLVTDPFWNLAPDHAVTRKEIFTGMLVVDSFTVFMRAVLFLFALLFIGLISATGVPDREDSPDILTLVLGATLGMCLMASANHLLMVFMAVEMASVPSYALAGMMKGRREASEAALKYAVYGAGAAGVLVYGISLIAGVTNTAHLPTLAVELSARLGDLAVSEQMAVVLGGLMIMVGLAFKLSAFPFHFWAPDVFEGASAEVGAFLSVASKAGALALLIRVVIGFSMPAPAGPLAAIDASSSSQLAMFNVDDAPVEKDQANAPAEAPSPSDAENPAEASIEETEIEETEAGEELESVEPAAEVGGRGEVIDGLAKTRSFLAKVIALFAALTCTFGNLAAYGQTNIKRLLGYSTIAHAGYMMMAVPAMLATIGVDNEIAQGAVTGLAIYIVVYLFMNLGAFATVAFFRNRFRTEEIADYGGLIKRCPITVVLFSLILFSLVGLPPLSGFIGKFAVFASLASSFRATSQSYLLGLLLIGGANTAISLFYYLRVVKVMTMDPEPELRSSSGIGFVQGTYIFVISLPTLLLIVGWNWLSEMASSASRFLM